MGTVDIKSHHLALLLKVIAKNTSEIPQNAEKELQAKPVHSWLLHGVLGLHLRMFFLSYLLHFRWIWGQLVG